MHSLQTQEALKHWDLAVAAADPHQMAAVARDMFAAMWESGAGNRANELLAHHLPPDLQWVMINLEELSTTEQKPRPNPQLQSAVSHSVTGGNLGALQHAAKLSDLLQSIVQALANPNVELRLIVMTQLRLLLSLSNPPVSQVVAAGALPLLVGQLQDASQPQLQLEAAWILTNLACGTSEETESLVQHGLVPHFVQLVSVPNLDLAEQAVWVLGSIAGDSSRLRDVALAAGALGPVLAHVRTDCQLSLLRISAWTLSNLLRGRPPPPRQVSQEALPGLALLLSHPDSEVLADALWALSHVVNAAGGDRIGDVLAASLHPRVIALLGHADAAVQAPALRTMGTMATGDTRQTQALLDAGLLARVGPLLSHAKGTIRKEACWTLANVTAGSAAQLQAVLAAGLVPGIVELARSEGAVKKEVLWALSNASAASPEQTQVLVHCGVLDVFLDADNVNIVLVTLEALEAMLNTALRLGAVSNSAANPVLVRVEACGGQQSVEALRAHSHTNISQKAVVMVETLWGAEADINAAQ